MQKYIGANHTSLATALDNLASLYENLGKKNNVLSLYQNALDIREKALMPDHLDIASNLNNLANL